MSNIDKASQAMDRTNYVTADNITDGQLLEVYIYGNQLLADAMENGTDRAHAFDVLLSSSNAIHRNLDSSDGNGTWNHWRGRCAEILNARNAAVKP